MNLTLRFYSPRSRELLDERSAEVASDADDYEAGRILAELMRDYIRNNVGASIEVSGRLNTKLKIIRKNAGALIIEEE